MNSPPAVCSFFASTGNRRKAGRPVMTHYTLEDAARRLDWDASALRKLLAHTGGAILPGSTIKQGVWSIPESAIRRVTGSGLFLFSIPTLSRLLDCDAGHLRRMAKAGKLQVIEVQGIGKRVKWAEYQRLANGRPLANQARTCDPSEADECHAVREMGPTGRKFAPMAGEVPGGPMSAEPSGSSGYEPPDSAARSLDNAGHDRPALQLAKHQHQCPAP